MIDGEPKYPVAWSGNVRVPGKYVLVKGSGGLKVGTGWSDTLELPRVTKKGASPDIMGADAKPLKGEGPVLPKELNTVDMFYIIGDYVVPFNFKSPPLKKVPKYKSKDKGKTARGKKQEESDESEQQNDSDDDNEDDDKKQKENDEDLDSGNNDYNSDDDIGGKSRQTRSTTGTSPTKKAAPTGRGNGKGGRGSGRGGRGNNRKVRGKKGS